MQVFLPIPDILEAPRYLDPPRLGNQIYREALTISRGKWRNHPASKLWYPNHLGALALYCLSGLDQLAARGHHYPKWYDYYNKLLDDSEHTQPPAIVGHEPFHAGHRAALLAKNPQWFAKFGWSETPEPDTKKAYIWSTQ